MPLDPNESIALIGAGGLGLAAVAMLRALGHAAILVVDPSADRRAAALEMGATIAIDGAGPDVAARILAAARPRAVLDFVGSDATAATAMAILPKGGHLVPVVANGGTLLGSARAPFPSTDCSSRLLLAKQSGAKVLGVANAGNDAVNIVKQASEFGNTPGQTVAGRPS